MKSFIFQHCLSVLIGLATVSVGGPVRRNTPPWVVASSGVYLGPCKARIQCLHPACKGLPRVCHGTIPWRLRLGFQEGL